MDQGGIRIVLTADRTLMADWPLLLDGMAAAAQTTALAMRLTHWYVARPVAVAGLRAAQAPLGLRRIEAALLRGGFGSDEVAVVPPERLTEAIGPGTRAVGLASGDPLGMGMTSTTVTALFGGEPTTSVAFQRLLGRVRRLVANSGSRAKVVVGGPGTWQFEAQPAARERLGIDRVVTGYCEGNAVEIFRDLSEASVKVPGSAGDAASGTNSSTGFIRGQGAAAEHIPAIRGPTVMGLVEASRGCGWGCRFCTLASEPMQHLPPETIMADVATNLAGNVANISLTSEDFLRYGAGPGELARPEAVLGLAGRLAAMTGIRTLAVDHANVATVSAFSDEELGELRRLLALGQEEPVWVNVGVETASGELLARSAGSAKMRPFGAQAWPEGALEQVKRLCRAGFLPMVSLVVGLEGETEEDLERTLAWVDRLAEERVAVVPVFNAPLHNGQRPDGSRDRTWHAADGTAPHQWELFRRSMRMTFRWLPALYWRHQKAARVGLVRRVALQTMGQGYSVLWKWATWRRAQAARRRLRRRR